MTMSERAGGAPAGDTSDVAAQARRIGQGIAKTHGKNQLVADDDERVPPE